MTPSSGLNFRPYPSIVLPAERLLYNFVRSIVSGADEGPTALFLFPDPDGFNSGSEGKDHATTKAPV